MAHKLTRLMGEVFNTPHLITAEAFDPIASYILNRTYAPELLAPVEKKTGHDHSILMNGDYAFIDVSGALTYKPFEGMCGPEGVAYTSLIEQAQEALDAGARNLVFSYSSGGGQAMGCFACAEDVRQMADEAGAKIYAFVEEGALSAAYAWAVTADEVVCAPYAEVGSIGCIVALMDTSERMKQAGFKRVVLTSTPGKSPYNEDGGFSQQFLDKLQEDVNRLGMQFAEHVSKYSGLSVETILALDAQSFHSEKAKEIGLINEIMTPREFLNYLSSKGA